MALLPSARWGLTAAATGSRVITVGGTADAGANGVKSAPREDVFNSDWVHLKSYRLAQLQQVNAATIVGSKVLFVGLDAVAQRNLIHAYDASDATWSQITLPGYRDGVAATALGQQAIFAGGKSIGGASPAGSSIADVYDATTGQLSQMRMPAALEDTRAAATSVCGRAIFTDGTVVDVYDSVTRRWSSQRLPVSLSANTAITVGTKAYFIGDYVHQSLDVYDGLTGLWSTLALPAGFRADTATALGTKAIFAGASSGTQPPPGDAVEVLDTLTGTWRATSLSRARDATAAVTVGDRAIFAGGKTGPDAGASRLVDVFTDASPTVSLDGTIAGRPGGDVVVTVRNTGDASLAARLPIHLYVAPADATAATAQPRLLGSTALPVPLKPGASLTLTVATTQLPTDIAPDDYRLTATVSNAAGTTTFAATMVAPGQPAAATVPAAPFLATRAILPLPAGSLGLAAVVGDQAFFGVISDRTTDDRPAIDAYSRSTGQWTLITPARPVGSDVATVGGKLIFAGGGTTPIRGGHAAGSAIDIYDTATGRWSAAQLSQPRFDMATITVGNKAIFAGGFDGFSYGFYGSPSDAVDIYDADTGQWSTAKLCQARGRILTTVVGTKAIFAGGFLGFGGSDAVDIYDSATGQWSTARIPQLPYYGYSYYGISLVPLGHQFIFSDSSNAYFYDTVTGQWVTKPLSHVEQITNSVEALAVGNLVLFAGEGRYDALGQRYVDDAVDVYHADTGGWTTTTLPDDGFTLWAGALGGKAVFFRAATGMASLDHVDVYDPASGQWTSLPYPRRDFSFYPTIAALGDNLIIAGPGVPGQTPPLSADVLSPTTVPPPHDPSVPDDAVLPTPPPLLSWSPTPTAAGYDIYLDGTLVDTVPTNQWTPATPILPGAHTWRVAARIGSGILTGPTWRFDVLAP